MCPPRSRFHRRTPPFVAFLSAAVLLAGVAHAAEPEGSGDRTRPRQPTLRVTADAEVRVDPDLAVVTVGATAQAKEAAAAQEQVSRAVRDTIARLQELGVPRDRIQTSTISLHPVYSQPDPRPLPGGARPAPAQEPAIVGYRATNTVEARLTDLSKIGDAIDAAVQAGANELRGVTFTLADESNARREALRVAADRAGAEARVVADALGLRLGRVVEASTAPAGGPSPRLYGAEMMAARAGSTPVEPGQVSVRAALTVTYRVHDAAGNAAAPAPGPPPSGGTHAGGEGTRSK